ncbi:MAG: glycosyltransferase [Cetobacterium sp.]|uniref:glycosyltransferase n=1 Tax=Cetobacterium sp. TaxID=2071632 RepID=UPI003F361F8D
MKKIAIVTRQMVMGGVEKVLIDMINSLPGYKYEIDLYVMAKGGELEKEIPSRVNVISIYGDENKVLDKIKKRIKKFRIIESVKIAFFYLVALKFCKYGYEQEKWLAKTIEKPEKEYDIAIAYHTPDSFSVIFVHDYLVAKKKIGWIHSDMSVYKNRIINYKKYYKLFDSIYCISKDTKNKFLEVYPELKKKVSIFYNIINEKQIINNSEKIGFVDNDFKGKRILTVGRLSREKNQIIIPEVLEKLLLDGYNLKWYLIGEGQERELLEKKINEKKLENFLILLGNKNNPYPYFKECDIYVQISKFEGYCTTITEAKLFRKPIVATNFTSIKEQIIDGVTGIIIENNIENIYLGIKKILDDEILSKSISKNLSKEKKNSKRLEINF